jgi:hypothetical protein
MVSPPEYEFSKTMFVSLKRWSSSKIDNLHLCHNKEERDQEAEVWHSTTLHGSDIYLVSLIEYTEFSKIWKPVV